MKSSQITPLQIAIDGPVAAGKSTVAKLLADKLDLLYIDTGAMYRATALAAQQEGVNWEDEKNIVTLMKIVKIDLERPEGALHDGRKITVWLNGADVSWLIRSQRIGEGASIVSQYSEVRKALVEQQQQIARGKRVVMEGRDIGSRVLPQAPVKLYLTADIGQRVKWKMQELHKLGEKLTEEEVKEGLLRRDLREKNRQVDPLVPAPGAWILDTTNLTIEQVAEAVIQRVYDLGLLV